MEEASISIFRKKDMTLAIQLAKDISWLVKQRERLGPFPSKDGEGWYAATGLCYDCYRSIIGNDFYKDYHEAWEATDNVIRKMVMGDDYETFCCFGPVIGRCGDCEERLRIAKEIEARNCRNCGRDCGHCSILIELEDLFN